MKIELFTKYVDNYFCLLEENFPNISKNNIKNNYINNKFLRYLLLIENDIVVGYLSYESIYDRIEIDNIEILKNYRGKGYSKLLMNKLIENAFCDKCQNITLEVNENNPIAINLYKKYDFKEVAIRKKYYDSDNAILMERMMK